MAQEISVRTVERALDILDCYASGKSGFTLTEIADMIQLSPSTTLRLLGTLEKKHYLYRDPSNLKYYLGFRLAQLSNLCFENLDYCRIAQPYLERLQEQFNESAGVYALKGHRRVCVARVEGLRRLRSIVQIGDSHVLTRGASGRILLAYQPPEFIQACIAEDSFCSQDELAALRKKGYAVSYGERTTGVLSVAAPLFNAKGKAIAALFLTGAESHFDEERKENVIAAICRYGREISIQLGYPAPDEASET